LQFQRPVVIRLFAVLLLFCSSVVFSQDSKTTTANESDVLFVCSARHPESVGPCAKPPRPTYTPDPTYTEQARQKHKQGEVVLYVVIGTDGLPRDVRVAQSLGAGLDDKAVEAVKQWRFAPATYRDKPVAVRINIEMNFKLGGGSAKDIPNQPSFITDQRDSKYASETVGMAATFPNDWRLVNEQSASLKNQVFAAVFAKSSTLASIVFTREHLKASPERYAKLMQQLLAKRENSRKSEEAEVTLDGITGQRWNVAWMDNGVEYRGVMEFFTNNDQHFRILTGAPDDVYDRYSSDFESILESVKFPQLHVSAQDLLGVSK
jgi:TonB family protein